MQIPQRLADYLDPEDWESLQSEPKVAQSNVSKLQTRDGVTKLVYETDPDEKALTGRSPQRIAKETSIPIDEMFPDDALILYVGDPWQRMAKDLDNWGMVVLEYEFGEVESFVKDNDKFREMYKLAIANNMDRIKREIEFAVDQDKHWYQELLRLVEIAQRLSDNADFENNSDYLDAASAWTTVKSYLSQRATAEGSEPGEQGSYDNHGVRSTDDQFRIDLWYFAVQGERGFIDLVDWKTKVQPQVQAKAEELDGLPRKLVAEELATYELDLIRGIRTKKKSNNSTVLQGIFPQLPIAPNSFDRFVASWSISVHTFNELDFEGFTIYWDEIYRVLKPGGKAYLFPLNHHATYSPEELSRSLETFTGKHSNVSYEVLDCDGEVVKDVEDYSYYGMNLVISKAE